MTRVPVLTLVDDVSDVWAVIDEQYLSGWPRAKRFAAGTERVATRRVFARSSPLDDGGWDAYYVLFLLRDDVTDLSRPTLLAQLARCGDPVKRRGEPEPAYQARLARLRAKGVSRPAGAEPPLT